ncbi:MAG TPA: response regulator [Verrucomicrobiae bacterium]|jgi:CheY-like chemotaxis protein|nr:response regulator [Verrucomicrobiae bacterium]
MDRAKPHFIIVDDDKDVRYFIRRVIQRRFIGVEIREASDGVEALRLFEHGGADLMVIDHNLPSMSGADLVRELRARNTTIPIVMVSSFPAVREEAMTAGATSFVGKDEINPALADQLANLLAVDGAREEAQPIGTITAPAE